MSFGSSSHTNVCSKLSPKLKRRRNVTSIDDEEFKTTNGHTKMVPKIRVVSGGYEPVSVVQDDISVENGEFGVGTDEMKASNGGDMTSHDHIDITNNVPLKKDESSFTIAFEVLIPFLIAGLGTVAAGLLLDKVQVSIVVNIV